MSEDPTAQEAPATTEGTPVVVAPETPQAPETPTPVPASAAVTPSWQEELEKVDPKELRRHPRIAGLIGNESQRALQEWQKKQDADQAQRLREQTEEELLKFTEEHEDYIRDNYPRAYESLISVRKQREAKAQDSVRGQTVQEMATNIGLAIHDVPEWKELTDTDHQALAERLVGKPDEEVLGIFNRYAIDTIAEKRANKKLAEWREKELAKEREALKQQLAAEMLRDSEAPDTARHKGTPERMNINGLPDDKFNDWWNSGKG